MGRGFYKKAFNPRRLLNRYKYCPFCNKSTEILYGCYLCCGNHVGDKPRTPFIAKKFISEEGNDSKREYPSRFRRIEVLKEQENRCIYCGVSFLVSNITWDHFKPFSVFKDNSPENFVAACRECNAMKAARVFETIDEVRRYVQEKRERRDRALRTMQARIL